MDVFFFSPVPRLKDKEDKPPESVWEGGEKMGAIAGGEYRREGWKKMMEDEESVPLGGKGLASKSC